MPDNIPHEFSYPRLILCEGPHDCGFFRALIAHRNLKPFHIRHPGKLIGPGISGFRRALLGFQATTGYEHVKDLIIVADNDSDPTNALSEVRKQIIQAGLSPPGGAGSMMAGNPNVHILMIPSGNLAGSLESLCYEAAIRQKDDHARCIDDFANCTGTTNWPPQKLAKMKLRSFLASNYRKNPDILFSRVWVEEPDLIPLNDAAFDGVANYLKRIA